MDVIAQFLPAQLDDAALSVIITDTIAELGAAGMKDMGKVMNALRPQLQGRADMGAVSAKIKARLA